MQRRGSLAPISHEEMVSLQSAFHRQSLQRFRWNRPSRSEMQSSGWLSDFLAKLISENWRLISRREVERFRPVTSHSYKRARFLPRGRAGPDTTQVRYA